METQIAKLYGGNYEIEFNPRAHRYKVLGKDALPDGVTTICNAVIPKFLDDWAGRVCVDHVRRGLLSSLGEHGLLTIGRDELEALCEVAETAHQDIRNSAGDRGSTAHDYIENYLKGNIVVRPEDPIVLRSLDAFDKWKAAAICEVTEAERIVFSKELYYCGKCDVYGVVDGRLAVVDFKTGSGFYDDHPYQLCGYAYALEEELGVRIEDGYIVHLDKRDGNYYVYHVPLNDGMKDAWRLAVLHYKELKKVRQMVKEMKNGMAKGSGKARQFAGAV